MEKVNVINAIDTGKKTQYDQAIIKIKLEDGRSITTWESDALNWAGEMELDITEKIVKGVKYYNAKKPSTKKSFTGKDYTFEKRNASLQLAVQSAIISGKNLNSQDILKVAESYYEYLIRK